jgi:hypothetical protein
MKLQEKEMYLRVRPREIPKDYIKKNTGIRFHNPER